MTDTDVPSVAELMRQQVEQRDRKIVEILLGATAGVLPSDVTTSVEFEIQLLVIPSRWRADEQLVINRVRVETSRGAISRHDEDANGRIDVAGYGVRATRQDLPDRREQWAWHSLPDELAAPLVLAAFTRTPVVKEANGA